MHFYTETEQGVAPRHFVRMTKDPSKKRPSRVTDARKAAKQGEVWYPSVTGILGVLDKPALLNWKVDKHLEQAFKVPQSALSIDAWIKEVKKFTARELDEAPRAGTNIHQILEDYLFTGNYPPNPIEKLIVSNCEEIIFDKTGSKEFNKEKHFIEKKHGYAGCADLYNDYWVIDYKSKQLAAKFKPGKMAYPEHSRQLAAYATALIPDWGFDTVQGANIFVCLETGEVDFHEHDKESLEDGLLDFLSCLDIYSRNTYKAANLT